MPSSVQWGLGSIALASFLVNAVTSDRMAQDLVRTGEARYENPRVRPGVGLRKWDLGINYKERFPARTGIRMTAYISSVLGALFLAGLLLTLPRHPKRVITPTYQYNQ